MSWTSFTSHLIKQKAMKHVDKWSFTEFVYYKLHLFLFQNTMNLERYNYTKGFLTSQELDFFLPSSIIWTDHKTRTKLWKLINTTHIDDYYCIESMECSAILKQVGNFLEKEKKSERKDDSYHYFIASIYILGSYYSYMNRLITDLAKICCMKYFLTLFSL